MGSRGNRQFVVAGLTYAHMTGETVPCQPGEGTRGPRPVLALLNLAGSSSSLYLTSEIRLATEGATSIKSTASILCRINWRRDIDELDNSLFERFALKNARGEKPESGGMKRRLTVRP